MLGFIGSADVVASGTCIQCANFPACEAVRKVLSENEVQVTVVGCPFTRPDDVLDGAGKATGRTSGVAILCWRWKSVEVDLITKSLRSESGTKQESHCGYECAIQANFV